MKALLLGDICPTAVNYDLFRQEDIPALLEAGLEAVFPDGASIADVADFLRRRCALTGTY